ncbi:MAG: VanZ family protein [Verrucomicrobiota bacterium]
MTRAHIWPICMMVAIFFASGQTDLAAPQTMFPLSQDKIFHFLVFGLLATAVLRIPELQTKGWIGALIAALIVSTYGGLDEYRQSLTPGRSVELADWIADTLGAITAVIVYQKSTWYRNFLEFRVQKSRPPNEERLQKKTTDDSSI